MMDVQDFARAMDDGFIKIGCYDGMELHTDEEANNVDIEDIGCVIGDKGFFFGCGLPIETIHEYLSKRNNHDIALDIMDTLYSLDKDEIALHERAIKKHLHETFPNKY